MWSFNPLSRKTPEAREKSDAELDQELNQLLADLSGGDFYELSIACEDLAYQGFDSTRMMKGLQRKVPGKPLIEFHKDIRTLAVLGTFKGNKVQKILAKTNEAGKNWMYKMVAEYGIQDTPTLADTVTLPRLASVFASQICKGFAAGKFPGLFSLVRATEIHAEFPEVMCIKTFGEVIPNDITASTTLKRAFMYVQYLFDCKIKKQRRRFTKADLDKIENFANIQFKSPIVKEADRVRALQTIGITDQTGELAADKALAIIAGANKWLALKDRYAYHRDGGEF